MRRFILLILAASVLSACAVTPNKTKVITAETLDALSFQIDQYEKRGWIDDRKEDEIQKKILFAFDLLAGSESSIDAVYCPESQDQNSCITEITSSVEKILRDLSDE